MTSGTVFDLATVDPPGGSSNAPGTREYPPYNEEWEAKYAANRERVRRGEFPDPISTCGTPAGLLAADEHARRNRVRRHAGAGLDHHRRRAQHHAHLHRRSKPPGTRMIEFACAENNRNPVDAAGRTLTLDQDGNILDDL